MDEGAEPPPPTPPAKLPLAPISIEPPACEEPDTDPEADEGKGRGKGDAEPLPDEVVDTLGDAMPNAGVGKLSDDTVDAAPPP